MDFIYTIAHWVSNISGGLCVLTAVFWILSFPTSDKRFGTGYKDNAVLPGCGMPIFAIITGLIAYYTSKDGFIYILLNEGISASIESLTDSLINALE